jgi:hypothetical protein
MFYPISDVPRMILPLISPPTWNGRGYWLFMGVGRVIYCTHQLQPRRNTTEMPRSY